MNLWGSTEMNTLELLRDYFPEIDMIEDESLKEKMAAAWQRAMDLGGLKTKEDLDKLPFTLLLDTGANFMQKTQGMVKLAVSSGKILKETYGDLLPLNMDYLIIGAILLDVGKLVEIVPDGKGGWVKSDTAKVVRHPVFGAMLCWEAGLPVDICNMVAFHSSEGKDHPRTPESWVMHHVDFIMFDPFKWKLNK
jgi:hypothetical protein